MKIHKQEIIDEHDDDREMVFLSGKICDVDINKNTAYMNTT